MDDLGEAKGGGPTRPRATVEDVLAVFALAALVVLTFLNVVVRYFTNHSFAVTEEISIFLLVALTLAGASAAAGRDSHIRIEYFLETGSEARRRRLLLFAAVFSIVFFLVLAALSGRYVWDEYRYGETSMALGVPRWWYSIWLPVLMIAVALRAFGFARRLWRRQ